MRSTQASRSNQPNSSGVADVVGQVGDDPHAAGRRRRSGSSSNASASSTSSRPAASASSSRRCRRSAGRARPPPAGRPGIQERPGQAARAGADLHYGRRRGPRRGRDPAQDGGRTGSAGQPLVGPEPLGAQLPAEPAAGRVRAGRRRRRPGGGRAGSGWLGARSAPARWPAPRPRGRPSPPPPPPLVADLEDVHARRADDRVGDLADRQGRDLVAQVRGDGAHRHPAEVAAVLGAGRGRDLARQGREAGAAPQRRDQPAGIRGTLASWPRS